MRLFPPADQAAEQCDASDIDKQSAGIIAGLSIATCGLVFKSEQLGGIRALGRGSKRLALLTRCIAYGTAAVLPFALHERYVEQRIITLSYRSEDSPVPRTVFADRLSHFDSDNAIILGGLTGAIIASRLRRPGSVASWQRYAAAMAIGAAPPTLTFWMCSKIKQNQNEQDRATLSSELVVNPLSSDLELASPSDFLRSALDSAWSGGAALATEGPQKRPGHDGSSMAMLGMPGGPGGDSSGSGGSWGSPTGAPMNMEILADGPHLVVKQNGKEPQIQPQTNYGWYSENKIAELEEQIANMRKKRLQLAQEAEFVWAWLSEKEAEHLEKYPVTKKPEETDEKESLPAQESSMVVQTLGQVHASIWREASTCDWIIADSQKRIAQEKSLAAKGKVEWRSSCSEAASKSALDKTLEIIKTNIAMQSEVRSQIDQSLSSLAMGLADPSVDLNARGMHPIKKVMAPHKEIIKDIREHLQEQNEVADLFVKTLKKTIQEAERRAGRRE